MIKKILDWMDERIEIRKLWDLVTNRPIPGGASWFYVLGATLLFFPFYAYYQGWWPD